jgi:hypothetical protein
MTKIKPPKPSIPIKNNNRNKLNDSPRILIVRKMDAPTTTNEICCNT